jgi:hypothetical protein
VRPGRLTLRSGTTLWRVHREDRAGDGFQAAESSAFFGGGRFDATPDDKYAFLYAAFRQETAILESLVRAIPFDSNGRRLLRRPAIARRRLSGLTTTRDLDLISLLTAADLAAVCQDEWLVQADPRDYPQTRHWGHWIRASVPWVQGFAWPSRRDLGSRAVVLFGDRCPDGTLRVIPGASVDLGTADGAAWLNTRLAPYRITVRRPRPRLMPGPPARYRPAPGAGRRTRTAARRDRTRRMPRPTAPAAAPRSCPAARLARSRHRP